MTDGYDVSDVLPDGAPDRLEAGTNVVIVGPTMSGKQEVAIRLLAAGYRVEEGILCITTERTSRLFGALERHVEALDRRAVGVVDCAGKSGRSAIEAMTESVSSPGDLTGISIGTAKLYEQFADRGVSNIRYGLISVSTLLQHLQYEKVFQFLYVYGNRIGETDGLGIYTLGDDAHEPRVLNTIRGQFDGAIEIRLDDDGDREWRVRGFGSGPTAWASLE